MNLLNRMEFNYKDKIILDRNGDVVLYHATDPDCWVDQSSGKQVDIPQQAIERLRTVRKDTFSPIS